MLEIVICDDEKKLRNDLRTVLEIELDLYGCSYRITEYECGEQLVREARKKNFDIIFLDIEMKELDGVETAKQIRLKNKSGLIIFVTSYPDFVFQGYEVKAFHYILKPYNDKKILKVLHRALEEINASSDQYYMIEQKSGTIRLSLNKTKYFISERRMITAVTEDDSYSFYQKLNELEQQLPQLFVRIHNRYLVNLNYVSAIEGNKVRCKDELLPVSQTYKQELAVAFAKYMLR